MTSNSTQPPLQSSVLGELPFEIAARIFSYINQRECLTCMAVCRAWYSTVPQYSRDVWANINITREFLTLLQRLAHAATDLSFHRHDMGPDVIELLDSCPRLTRFSFKHADYDNRLVKPFADPPKTDEFIHLKRLSVEIHDNDLEKQLIPVLQKSPNLEQLVCHLPDCFDVDDAFHRTTAISADSIALWCPKLVSLELISLYRDSSDEPDTVQLHPIKTSAMSPGLRSLTATETESLGPDTIGPFLLRNADTLETISLTKYSLNTINDWSSMFSKVEFPNLRTLELYAIGINDAATNRLLAHCPALESLYIYTAENPPMIHLAQALENLTQLKTIELQSVQIAQEDFDAIIASKSKLERAEFRDVIPVTDTLLQRLPLLQSLKQLHISFSEIRQDHTDAGLHQFVEMLSRSKLQILHLEGLQNLRSDAIQALANLPCLEWIILCGPEGSSLKCDGPSLVRMIDNCESLKWAKLSDLELTGTDMDLLAYLKQEVKTCKDIRNMPMVGGVCLMK
ncbi:hypothetical protein BJV82DRAFT_397991 [Fennellomyces sp. T-0311]|nr:hypothetical protein BJV82DRAFT_397991 [Fennellomyces sp. T-0311]